MGEPGGLPSMGAQSRTRQKRLSSSSTEIPDHKIVFHIYVLSYLYLHKHELPFYNKV